MQLWEPMWRVVTQMPARALGLGLHLWGLYLHLLSLGLWALPLGFLVLLQELCVCVRKGGRAVYRALCSAALLAQVCTVYSFLQGLAWSAQLAGSWVTLHIWLLYALLETLRRIPLIPLCEQAARWLVRAGVQACRRLSQLRGTAAFVLLCAHTLLLGMYLCMHVCFAAISSRVRVKVLVPFRFSWPVRVHAPLNLGIKVRRQGQRHGRSKEEALKPQGEMIGEEKSHASRSLQPSRRREVSPSRSEPSSGR